MKVPNNFSTSIHTVLKDLIEEKSRRDNVKFTSYQLASALSMPRSIITKLTHSDESKRICNPKIDTLIRIVEYFREDGFNITIDDILGIKNRSIDVQSQQISSHNEVQSILLYSLNDIEQRLGTIETKLPSTHKNLLALYSEEDIGPFFKIGSIFIVDLDLQPTHEMLIAIKLDDSEKIQLKKYYQEKNTIILKSLNYNNKDITLMPTKTCRILGVIVHVNAKT